MLLGPQRRHMRGPIFGALGLANISGVFSNASSAHPGRSWLWGADELLTHAIERSFTDAWRVRVAGAMDQRRLLSLSTTGPVKRVSPH
jgi:hypothetical protein